jgi:hypothetical protein
LDNLLQTSIGLDAVKADLLTEIYKIHSDHENIALSVVSQVKDWFSSRFGLMGDHRAHKNRHHQTERGSFFNLEDIHVYALAPEHAPALELYQSPMDMNGRSNTIPI